MCVVWFRLKKQTRKIYSLRRPLDSEAWNVYNFSFIALLFFLNIRNQMKLINTFMLYHFRLEKQSRNGYTQM